MLGDVESTQNRQFAEMWNQRKTDSLQVISHDSLAIYGHYSTQPILSLQIISSFVPRSDLT